MVKKSEKFDEWLLIRQTFSYQNIILGISEHVTLTFIKDLLVKVLCVLHLSGFPHQTIVLYGISLIHIAHH